MGSSHPLKLCAMKSKMKCMVITFFNQEGLVYTHAVRDGQTSQCGLVCQNLEAAYHMHIPSEQPHYHNG